MSVNNLVSVIVPAYNHEKYIKETINSIIDQTYKNIELIIVDDGSKDSTLQKINEMREICEKRFVRFVVEAQENQGTCTTMNRLYEIAKGDYVYIIASDDIAASEAIQTLHDFLSQNENYALAVGENKIIDEDSKLCYWDKNKNIVYNIEECFYHSYSDFLMKWATNIDFFSDEFGSYPLLLLGQHVPNGTLIRKSIFEKTGYHTKKAPLEDYYIFLQIAKYSKMKYIPKPLFYYRWHGANSVKQSKKMSKFAKKTRLYEIEMVKKSKDPQIKKHMQDYMNSFPINHFIKIPFIFEVFEQKTLCFQKIIMVVFGIRFVINKKNI